MEDNKVLSLKELSAELFRLLMENYWSKIWQVIKENPEMKKTFTTFLLNPEKLIFYIGKNHWAVEYIGEIESKEVNSRHQYDIRILDYSSQENFLEEIIGVDFSEQTGPKLPLPEFSSDLVVPTNEAFDIMVENGWNLAAQPMFIGFNMGGYTLSSNSFYRIINSFFYGTKESGLVTRHIKWLDIFPLQISDASSDIDEFKLFIWPNLLDVIIHDCTFEYPIPDGYREEKWYQLNRFVELISSKETSEPQITNFLSQPENQFILKMALMGKEIYPECELEWQSEINKKPIRPDFFIKNSNGFSDIVEFKLPTLKGNTVVGRENRETFSAEVQSYISQTRDYEYYFEDPNNRKYAEDKYGIKVQYPKRILIMGRRWMLDSPDWRRLENDNRNITIKSYDEIIDLVLSHLYL